MTSYQEEERTRLRRQSTKQAIDLAMQGWWREAIAANKGLLESFPDDVDTYNRLGRAYMELGEYLQAREAYEKALELDPYNIIARKNINRLSHLGEGVSDSKGSFHKVEPHQFIEEVGKAGVVSLCCLAPLEILAKTVAGSRVNLKIDGPHLIAENSRGEYLGQVEAKYGQRLIKLMERGNKYTATLVSSTEGVVTVIIREIYQHPSQAGRFSFPPKGGGGIHPFVDNGRSDRIIRREIEYEEALPGELAYTVIGGAEGEMLTEESDDTEDDEDENEE
ncbi:tetratricopeptide repeat protein [Chloroflexota bacterium]